MDEGTQSAALAPNEHSEPQNHVAAKTAASGASAAPLAGLDGELEVTFTIDQARALFFSRNRKVPSERTMQTYCLEKKILSRKMHTSFRRTEYLINEPSLFAFIEQQPIVTNAPAALAALVHQEPQSHAPGTTAGSAASGARDDEEVIGERRSLAEVLIENAKLIAVIEGKDKLLEQIASMKNETIAELKDDRSFLREEIVEARKQRNDVKEIANKMLDVIGRSRELPAAHDPEPPTIIPAVVLHPNHQGGEA